MSILSFFRNRNNTGKDRYILCIDGGGMRGIVPVMVLQRLEILMREAHADKPIQSYFDLIAGTSTGGLIASSLVFPERMSKDSQVDLGFLENVYMTCGRKIFPSTGGFRGIVNVPYQVVADKYPVDGLEELLANWFGDVKLNEAKVPTLLMAYNLTEGNAELMKSYEPCDLTVAQACRATSAAPTYFAPMKHSGCLLADGGIAANNPSLYAYHEAKKMYPDCKKFHILSIGTAAQLHRTDKDTSGLLSWIDQISPMYMTAQKQTVSYTMANLDDVEYVRIDRELDEALKMDDVKEKSLQKLRDFGKQLADDNEQVLKDFARKLVR